MIAKSVKAPNRRYLELDALRGFAAMFVMLFHYTEGKNAPEAFTLGVTGVDFFFLISGFVIFMSINKVASGKEFIINRIVRLYPTYWASVTFTFGVIVLLKAVHFKLNHAREVSFTDYLVNLTMSQYYFNIKNIDVPYWTLIIEVLFYLLILALYQLKLLKHIIPIGCAINSLIIINYVLFTQGIISNYTGYFPLMNHFALFLGGIIFYMIITNAITKLTGYLAVLFCLLTQTIVFKFAGSDPDHISFMQYACMLAFYFITFVLFINDKLKFIISKPALFLGNVSFALYLIHNFVFRGLIGYIENHFNLPYWLVVLFMVVPVVILLAYLITKYIEKPLGKSLKNAMHRIPANNEFITQKS
ncbi:MAG: hypothetical protein JWR05_2394 [Mucilaginibacter sp.]|nr:hypothetical protein [Mucilaginibacter sp.]